MAKLEMKRTLRIFHKDGRIEKMKVVNEYHAQNILSLLFSIGDKNGENDVVFAELLDSRIFAWAEEGKGITIRNATQEFLNQIDEMQKENDSHG